MKRTSIILAAARCDTGTKILHGARLELLVRDAAQRWKHTSVGIAMAGTLDTETEM